MQKIIDVHFPDVEQELVTNAMKVFYGIREIAGVKKKPSTSELIDWLKLLLMERIQADLLEEIDLNKDIPPHLGALIKNEQDLNLMEALRKGKRFY